MYILRKQRDMSSAIVSVSPHPHYTGHLEECFSVRVICSRLRLLHGSWTLIDSLMRRFLRQHPTLLIRR